MVFSIDTVNNRKNKSSLLEEKFDFDISFFSEALEMITDENYTFFKELNWIDEESLEEGIVANLVINGVKMFDFNTFISKLLDWFINCIGKLSGSFNAFMLNFINDDAELRIYKSKLQNFRLPIKYSKPYYEYRNLGVSSETTLRFKEDIDSELDQFMGTFNNPSIDSTQSLLTVLESAYNDKKDIETKLGEIRGELCGQNNTIGEDSFATELFNYYRTTIEPNNINMSDVEIPSSRVVLAVKDYYSSAKQQAIVKREQWKFRAESTSAKAKVRTYNPFKGSNLDINSEVLISYNRYASLICSRIQKICNLYIMAFSSKLDAIKEYNKLNKEFLLIACKLIAKEKL